jgi:hypothetical protein
MRVVEAAKRERKIILTTTSLRTQRMCGGTNRQDARDAKNAPR